MYQRFSYSTQQTFFQKVRSMDYILLFSILSVGLISGFSMYSIDGGSFEYYTQNHLIRFSVFFILMLIISFVNIKVWHATGYIFYLISLGLLFWASFYGVTASGSQR